MKTESPMLKKKFSFDFSRKSGKIPKIQSGNTKYQTSFGSSSISRPKQGKKNIYCSNLELEVEFLVVK